MKLRIGAATHLGLVRTSHQDCLHIDGWTASSSGSRLRHHLDGHGVVAVIDGMGGHAGGEVAARITSAHLADCRLANATSAEDVDQILQQVSDHVRGVGAITEGHANMGATIAGFVVTPDDLLLFNVGDCSILRITDGFVGQLAVIDRTDVDASGRTRLTQCLGGATQATVVDAHAERFAPREADVLVLCSDGLTDVVDDATIGRIVAHSKDVVQISDELVSAACRAGAPDNVSIVAVRLG
ncbi:PP2C family protein-serine/threonine phosphatase [Aeromicrobium duanguangcaii]|uniref:Serine/threonine-protein phosphatase n=1 Tax=Aeromicrobium duanguangcaii TaxID=2968086 RepID=A0ABY5KB07_9ACTN|nr:PP2C family serine/threonine-protein phosphatase [Aeromicrobium duanguangcaii]MCD9152790.1 serine/threonine-protein phosphatase [Aeromicrobium duanguangcaii]UUI67228.1 serine/threonine-protein phosphatase [Aeromicrobium duanguangcaii]